jgi:uncharacterized membrane protein
LKKQQYLNELRNCLEGEVSQREINENIAYYDQYFDEQTGEGKREEQVCEELGSPSLIARSIVDASEGAGSSYYEETIFTEDGEEESTSNPNMHMIEIKWYHKLLFILAMVAIIILICVITGAVLSFLGPILLVILLIYLIQRLFF